LDHSPHHFSLPLHPFWIQPRVEDHIEWVPKEGGKIFTQRGESEARDFSESGAPIVVPWRPVGDVDRGKAA